MRIKFILLPDLHIHKYQANAQALFERKTGTLDPIIVAVKVMKRPAVRFNP